ncbi:MAG: ribonuclease E/G, partial [Rhodovarius sp.]|nr:ribonuclease E/G [Rhodovarius sp.]
AAEEEASDAEFGAVEEDEEDLAEERIGRRVPPRFLRNYKIQEVIKRRQIMLVQVVKEERGGKGAALTTYISLAGRFSVLMPNTPRGGGVSRKITSLADRRRLREVIDELDLPPGMSLIIRTAGAQRPKAEIRRDCEALLRLWDSIRERTLASVAPALIYQEADLIKRAIRDGYARDVDEILVEGEEAYNQVRDVMRMLMPEAVRKVQLYRDGPMPLFARYGVEQQLEAMHNQVVPLKSGGTIVIHQTEALVAIDVNSGRSTRERNIEDTALRTNLEAAEEIARQLRLRDLAGLIVIDFIDMESPKNNAAVEKRLKEALKNDRARIQVGRISHFGLLEMSRQRLRPSLMEQTFQTCPHCQGRGVVRSPESAAIQVLRALEEEGAKRRAAEVLVHVRPEVAMYLLNRKRDRLNQIEERFGMLMQFSVAEALPPHLTHKLERLRAADQRPAQEERSQPPAIRIDTLALPPPTEAEEDEAAEAAGEPGESEAAPLAGAQAEGQERRRRRRRRRRRSTEASAPPAQAGEGPGAAETATEAAGEASAPIAQPAAGEEEGEEEPTAAGEAPIATEEGQERPRRRRGRRGGRRRREGSTLEPMAGQAGAAAAEAASGAVPFYVGPTPADPFAADIDPVIAAMEAAERAAEEAAARSARSSSGPSGEAAAPALPQPSRAEPAAEPPPSPAPVDAAPAEVAAAGPAPAAGQAVGGSAESPPAPEAAPAAVAASPPPPEPADSGPVVGPPVQPVLVDALTDVPRKRGWWRR